MNSLGLSECGYFVSNGGGEFGVELQPVCSSNYSVNRAVVNWLCVQIAHAVRPAPTTGRCYDTNSKLFT